MVKAMKHDEIARQIVKCALELYKELGPGLLESVYEVLIADGLRKRGLSVERQKPIPIVFAGSVSTRAFAPIYWSRI
jgi:GxxExxY protein